MCWPVDRPATHAAAGAAARGVRGDWGILLRLDWEPLRERTLDHRSGQTRMPPQERRHEEVFGLGDCFTRTGVTARGGFLFGGFRTSGAATAVTENNRRELFHPRRCAVSCEAALRILSNGKSCPPCGRGCVCSGGDCGSGSAKRSFAGRIPKRSLGTTQRGGCRLF